MQCKYIFETFLYPFEFISNILSILNARIIEGEEGMSNLRKQIKWLNKRGFVLFSLTPCVSVLLLTRAIV